MLLYCMGVMCSNPGGGTSQYRLGLRLLDDFLPRSPRSRDLDLEHFIFCYEEQLTQDKITFRVDTNT